MSFKSMPGIRPVLTVFLAISLGIWAAPPAAAQGLSGGSRETFRKALVEGCIRNAATDPDLAELPRAALGSFCRCSAAYIAAHATPAQLERPDSLATRAIVAEATRACFPGKQPA